MFFIALIYQLQSSAREVNGAESSAKKRTVQRPEEVGGIMRPKKAVQLSI
jgi:hypothetical protein